MLDSPAANQLHITRSYTACGCETLGVIHFLSKRNIMLEINSKSLRVRFAVVALVTFLAADNWRFILKTFMPQFYSEVFRNLSTWSRIELQAAAWIGVSLLGIFLVQRKGFKFLLQELGLKASVVRAVIFTFIATIPMSLGFMVTSRLNPKLSFASILHLAIISPFAEEVLYRGYLFRQLHRRAELGFVLAVIITAVFFGFGHYSDAMREGGVWNALGVVAITGLGGAFFAWLFVRWQDNLWVPFCMHCLMNLWWELFAVDSTALGGWLANIVRLLTVILAIVLTLYRDRLWKMNAA